MSRKYGGERDGHGTGQGVGGDVLGPSPGKIARTDGLAGEAVPKSPADAAAPMTAGATKVTHQTDQKAPGGQAETRTTVGVGELVYFTAETVGAKSKWKTTAGKGTDKGGGQYDWKAPAAPDTVTITFDPGDGGAATTVQMTVIGPTSIKYSNKVEDTFGAGKAGAGMRVDLEFLPLSVCFWGTQWRETDVDGSSIDGWFTHLPANKLKHKAAVPRDIGDDNKGPGDHISYAATGPFKETGSFSWVIPQQYSVKGANSWQEIATPFTQTTSIETDGTLTVSKHGESVKRSPSDP
jgi:hypothetical protein